MNSVLRGVGVFFGLGLGLFSMVAIESRAQEVQPADRECFEVKGRTHFTLCKWDQIVALASVPGRVHSDSDYIHGEAYALDPVMGAMLVDQDYYMEHVEQPIRLTHTVIASDAAKVKMPIQGKYPGDHATFKMRNRAGELFEVRTTIFETLSVGDDHSGFFVTEHGLLDLSKTPIE